MASRVNSRRSRIKRLYPKASPTNRPGGVPIANPSSTIRVLIQVAS